ncbi:MAG: tyrosine--tRNA ligase [Clostridiaceae bacterium]|nr:tyrosine--tRNA ligase [Clostridiaceae bacterium]
MVTPEEQLSIIKQGSEAIITEDELLDKLRVSCETRRPLRIKLGLDPSAPDIHLGHAVVLRKLRQLQALGHEVHLVIGDFTGMIGDPTGRSKTRKPLTHEEVEFHAATYREQVFRILDPDRTWIHFNSEWLSGLDFTAIIKLAGQVTVARLLERDDFANRQAKQQPIGLHEFFYPLMQGYDSIHLQSDIELGGTDQTFNILMGRTLQKAYGQPAQTAVFMPILEGLDGVEKMSKSLGNTIGIQDMPDIMFAKAMKVPDPLIIRYFELTTDIHPADLSAMKKKLSDPSVNPRDVKLGLARLIVAQYHGDAAAAAAEQAFCRLYRERNIPEQVRTCQLEVGDFTGEGTLDLVRVMVRLQMAYNNSEARRLIQQGGVRLDDLVVRDFRLPLSDKKIILWVGKHQCVQLINLG